MTQPYYIADVFTNTAFDGAQIAVFPRAESLTDEQMLTIAKEMNLSETVFVSEADGSSFGMRVFSPLGEVDFAGHPILATAYVLAENGDLTLTEPVTPVKFKQNIGEIDVYLSVNEGQVGFVQFSTKVSSVTDRFTPSEAELAEFLGIQVSDIDRNNYAARLVSCGFPYLVVPVWNYEAVRNAKFNYAAWSQSAAPQTAAQEILLFSPKTPYRDVNFSTRLMGPNIGINDDPPVGSAMPAFASYLCSFSQTLKGTHSFTVDRGDSASRRSVINIEMDNKGQADLALRIGGEAVVVAKGEFYC